MPDFKRFATTCALELSKNRDNYVREECEALETAVSFSTLLDDWKKRLGHNLADAARMLIETRKFRITGRRSAPIQVVGLGDVSGEKFSRGLILLKNLSSIRYMFRRCEKAYLNTMIFFSGRFWHRVTGLK
jgi:hypothetical protein